MGGERNVGRARDFRKAHAADRHLAPVLPHHCLPLTHRRRASEGLCGEIKHRRNQVGFCTSELRTWRLVNGSHGAAFELPRSNQVSKTQGVQARPPVDGRRCRKRAGRQSSRQEFAGEPACDGQRPPKFAILATMGMLVSTTMQLIPPRPQPPKPSTLGGGGLTKRIAHEIQRPIFRFNRADRVARELAQICCAQCRRNRDSTLSAAISSSAIRRCNRSSKCSEWLSRMTCTRRCVAA